MPRRRKHGFPQNKVSDLAQKRYIITDDDEEMKALREREKEEQTMDFYAGRWEQPGDFIPREKEIPDEGAWIQIIYPPCTEILVENLSVWYALPFYKKESWELLIKHEQPYKVKIITPVGELHLYPREYNVVSPSYMNELLNMIDGENHVCMNWIDPRAEDFNREKLFYITSRGIQKSDAYKMMIGDVMTQSVCFLTMHVEYQKMFAGVGVPTLSARSAVLTHIEKCEKLKAEGNWYKLAEPEGEQINA